MSNTFLFSVCKEKIKPEVIRCQSCSNIVGNIIKLTNQLHFLKE